MIKNEEDNEMEFRRVKIGMNLRRVKDYFKSVTNMLRVDEKSVKS